MDYEKRSTKSALRLCFVRGGGTLSRKQSHRRTQLGFTLAEVLITVGIIGVVAALTLPVVNANYQKHVMINRLKKTYSVLSQAFVMSELENGRFADWDASNGKRYFETYWKKYIKGVAECKTIGCGYDEVVNGGDVWRSLRGILTSPGIYPNSATRWYATMDDGTFLAFIVRTDTTPSIAVRQIYIDINGYKKPNTLGKDVFAFDITPKGLVAYGMELSDEEVKADCKKNGYGKYCAVLLYKNGWTIPADYPW